MNLGRRQKTALKILGITVVFMLIAPVGLVYLIVSDHVPEPGTYAEKQERELTTNMFFSIDVSRFPASANVTPMNISDKVIKVGIDPGTGALNFGRMYADMQVKKFINLDNSENCDVKVCVMRYGSIAPYINSSLDSFIMKPGEAKEIRVSFTGREVGYYEGEIDIVIKKMRYRGITPLLPWVGC